jgi:astacin (peptidase family M12A)
MSEPIVCLPRALPASQWIEAARTASSINPVNHPPIERLANAVQGFKPTPVHIALLTSKYWGVGGVHLTVGFLDNPEAALRARILSHMNAWAGASNVQFRESNVDPQVRIARAGDGYWSYVGTDILHIDADNPTMNLEAFTMQTPESEFHRVVRHETGHTMGFPHEHMRKELVALIDPQKAIAFFAQTQGWSADEVQAQVLTPLEDNSIMATPEADQTSIMCYQIPGSITKDGKAILGGTDIDPLDFQFAAKIYPPVDTGAAQPAKKSQVNGARVVSGANGAQSDVVLAFTPGTEPAYIAAIIRAVAAL